MGQEAAEELEPTPAPVTTRVSFRRRAGWTWRIAFGVALTIAIYVLVAFPVSLAAFGAVFAAMERDGDAVDLGGNAFTTIASYYLWLWPVVTASAVGVGAVLGAPLSILAERVVLRGRGRLARLLGHAVVAAIVGAVLTIAVVLWGVAVDGSSFELAGPLIAASAQCLVVAGAVSALVGHWLAARILPGPLAAQVDQSVGASS